VNYLFLAIAIVAEVIGTTFMKESDGFSRIGPSLICTVSYLVAFYFLALTLRTIPTGIAYAIWSGVGIVLITSAAWVFHGQKLDAAVDGNGPYRRRSGDHERVLKGAGRLKEKPARPPGLTSRQRSSVIIPSWLMNPAP